MKSTILSDFTDLILFNAENPGETYQAVHQLHDYLVEITGISGFEYSTNNDIFLPSGKAIGPEKAAHCLLEFCRTAVFIRGIYQAILQLQTVVPKKRINILYAGCGPYATLLTPLTSQFTSTEIRFILMDINPISLDASRKLYEKLGILEYADRFILEDAATYVINQADDIDLVISETMLNALRKEPQVAIMRNLIPQLKPNVIFIPEEITVDAKLTSWKEETERMMHADKIAKRIDIGKIFKISKTVLNGQEDVTLVIPHEAPEFTSLELFTFIRVFDNESLDAYTCSLTLPFNLGKTEQYLGKKLTFHYVTGENPHFEFKVA